MKQHYFYGYFALTELGFSLEETCTLVILVDLNLQFGVLSNVFFFT